ncbi:MAG: response regulator transcription factor [Pseudomonadota bacterium]
MTRDGGRALPLRLLLADDSAGFLAALCAYLLDYPQVAVVGTAASGEQAIALSERLAPDVVVMDLAMPGIGGIEATRDLKTRARAPTVLVLTLDARESMRRAALEAGADFFVAKDRLHEDFPAVLAQLENGKNGVRS